MITFNVGPSRISKEVQDDIKRAVDNGVLEFSHRSKEFTEVSKSAVLNLKRLLSIPDDYGVIFTSSATESMQLAVQNCCAKSAFHFVSGNFSKLFADISKMNHREVEIDLVSNGEINNFKGAEIKNNFDFIAITHNETSTGVMCSMEDIESVRESAPESILAVDITSSAGAMDFDFNLADIWLFSVQKCFGLPSGLGVLIFSPKAFEKSQKLESVGSSSAGIFTLENLNAKMTYKYQTFSTPNILGIYLLSETCQRMIANGGLGAVQVEMKAKSDLVGEFVERSDKIAYFVSEKKNRSKTVFCLKAEEDLIDKLHDECKCKGFLLGKGYGELKRETIRIANFPAIAKEDIKELLACMSNVLK